MLTAALASSMSGRMDAAGLVLLVVPGRSGSAVPVVSARVSPGRWSCSEQLRPRMVISPRMPSVLRAVVAVVVTAAGLQVGWVRAGPPLATNSCGGATAYAFPAVAGVVAGVVALVWAGDAGW